MQIIIFGCGGHARSILNTIIYNGNTADILLIDENAKPNENIMGFPVNCTCELSNSSRYIVAIGDNEKRKSIYCSIINQPVGKCTSVVSKLAHIGKEASIGQGVFIAPRAFVGPQAAIGDNTIINTGSVIEHEAVIGCHSHIAPHVTVCGRSKIGNNVFCGAGSTVIDRINVCDDVVIGAGAVVVHNISEPGTYVGVPARKIR